MNSDVEQYLCTTCGDHLVLSNGVQQEDGRFARGGTFMPRLRHTLPSDRHLNRERSISIS